MTYPEAIVACVGIVAGAAVFFSIIRYVGSLPSVPYESVSDTIKAIRTPTRWPSSYYETITTYIQATEGCTCTTCTIIRRTQKETDERQAKAKGDEPLPSVSQRKARPPQH